MLVSHQYENKMYVFSNENLKVGDEVFPISHGHNDGKKYIHEDFRYEYCLTGFPDEPHIIKDLHYSDDKAYEVYTTYGWGPKEKYFKIIAINRLAEDDVDE